MSNTPSPSKRMGRIETITSTANPRIKSIKSLMMKKNRDAEKLFIAEGEKLLTDALESGWSVQTMLYSKNALTEDRAKDRVEDLAARVRVSGGDVFVVNDKVLTSITKRDNAQAVVAVIEQRIGKIDTLSLHHSQTWLALDRVRDPGNLGTCIRTADALGISGVILVGETTDPFSMEAVRATMGSLFHVPLIKTDEKQFIAKANSWHDQALGQVIGTHLAGAADHRSIDFASAPTVVLMGNEQQGLTEGLAEACNELALIAMDGAADSLNLAVATGIMLFEARRHALPNLNENTSNRPKERKS